MIYKVTSSIFLTVVTTQAATIKKSSINILNSETLPGNLLPNFLFQQGSIEGGSIGVKTGGGRGTPKPFVPDELNPDDIFEGAMEDERSPQLPYLTQDLWTCDRTPEELDVWNLEDESLRVTISPQFAGKVWTIYDKVRERDILFNNRAHQPANIAALKSWASGGCEWNWSPGIIGHSVFSETQTFLTEVETERGPMARVYEYDRYNSTVWQVDMMIVNGTFLAHPRITNPTPVDLRGYWWTCVAVPATPTTRIFAPATHVAETSRGAVRDAPWPYFADAIENSTFKGYNNEWPTDNSYLGNHQLGDMFLRISDTVYTPYIAHTDLDGYVLVHGHPLNGTKFFTWGDSGPGRFMQDFLAGGGKRQGDYTELQIGPAPTQMQNFPVPAHSITEWTEWFRGFDGDVKTLRGEYGAALDYIEEWMKSKDGFTQSTVKDWDEFFKKYATKAPSTIHVRGQPWGALEELRRGAPLVPGVTFTLPNKGEEGYAEVNPWIELVKTGRFSEETLSVLPVSYQTTDEWLYILQESSKLEMTWLHALHLGIALTERGEVTETKKLFKQSLELKPNPIAMRNLAILETDPNTVWSYMLDAWNILPSWKSDPSHSRLTANMVTEMSFFLIQEAWYDEMEKFVEMVPAEFKHLDGFLTVQSKVYLHKQQYQEAESLLLSNCFPTYAKARDTLMSMWNEAQEGIAKQKKGSELTYVEKHRARVDHPIPDNIGCQYASEYCWNYW
mmetsp:Transcript_18921/g.19656  ORF Transcript_18921/g.19656 Transcript_18921/m.19656 type:complete len:730 (-) Transcript_18921:148-2337(-)|eukprot:CAMPEP_0174817742 /NCGR_PEP_ID=MMETSP1107-20130205/257_1 /TAXON_ID=36770 /ORGANISM="Paraphysomonas vestita, Strain GFlagA" /LENGTH=729 /DNA_ID=CAMNT_0016028727 /DNA_START=39 /DNA_END=2228 /DNA_ORIENTATION=-